jgi:HPt (histidine-containing phosphotransfer) domain-containing protein
MSTPLATPPDWDPQQLDRATGGDPALARRVVALYRQGLPALLARIVNLAQAGEFEALRISAHELKGSSATVGAMAVAQAAHALESIPPECREQIPAAITHLQQVVQRTLEPPQAP